MRGAFALLVSVSAVASMTASCSSSEDRQAPLDGGGPSGEAASPSAPGDASDGGIEDAARVDAAPLPITCEAPPCAVAIATTLAGTDGAREEGYCALLTDGTVACWGANTASQLGDPAVTALDSPVPRRVPGLSGITSISRTCAIDEEGSVFCWGRGPFLQSDAASRTVATSPVRLSLPGPAKQIAVGDSGVACSILRDERFVCWGSNFVRQVDPEASTSSLIAHPPREVEAAARARAVAVGGATLALFDDGRLLSWGQAPAIGRPTALAFDGWPAFVALEHITMIDTSASEVCAVADGVGWCWGAADPLLTAVNPNGLARLWPAAVDTPEPITRIAVAPSWSRSEDYKTIYEKRRWCATSVSGAVYCWGNNSSGQAGDGTKEYAMRPVRAEGLPAPAADVRVMALSTCAILTNGKVYCWGNNGNGQLGAGLSKGSFLVPTEVKLP